MKITLNGITMSKKFNNNNNNKMEKFLKTNNINFRIEYKNILNFKFKSYYLNEQLADVFMYPDYHFKFKNKMVNDDNTILYQKDFFKEDELSKIKIERVLQGELPMCVIYKKTEEEFKNIFNEFDLTQVSTFTLISRNSKIKDFRYALVISQKGKIGEIFDLKTLEDDYRNLEIPVDFKKYKNYEITDCFNIKLLESKIGDANIPMYLLSLFLGIPIENNISQLYEKLFGIKNLGHQILQCDWIKDIK